MNTINRKYTTISIPKRFEPFVSELQKAYRKIKGVNVSRGETVGIAVQNEYDKFSQEGQL